MIRSIFVQEPFRNTDEYREVSEISDQLMAHLNDEAAQTLIEAANAPGQSSALVQASFLAFARELGFRDEARDLFASYENRAVRPDYYRPLTNTGILLEVERGKTTINNMDFLDFWKCHLCEHASYLFLMVPQELRQNSSMRPRREYNTVVKRMASFFAPRNYTNVRGLHVFGY
ncbi:hypothetical protein [Phycicoccus sp. Soil748]|uniref:hypothetical protein n=1 Tax=Phycicoccus sp. Soil748 TaxID=1736397 RepID=UPI00070301F5|nr:hypothetical protein [Phycicoccus sp. Soil748]KRE56430.1 hypothetical protein ASG70_04750 [Phycicoccus sp. Soil748]